MIDILNGRYWDFGWQLIDGCTPCSPGCDNCWSAAMSHRVGRGGLTKFCGEFNSVIETHPDRFNRPLKRKKPAVYAIWNDLFHADVPDEFIFDTFRKICECRGRHAFLILTKRPGRMLKWINLAKYKEPGWFASGELDLWGTYLSLTVCNQQEWNENGALFLSTPGKKFISHEPALERIDYGPRLKEISCLIAGGETGPKARPSHPDVFGLDRYQCQVAGVPFFFKGWGEFISSYDAGFRFEEQDRWKRTFGKAWVKSRRSCRFEDGTQMVRVGKKAAGRILAGRTHDDLPWVMK